ncbi:hypothetical protein G5C60_12410 [Streptomyces sp. HC44]|uniref:Uncharacterized protein n=1 Tax=Streptomyces scabichelini TaxID=2711217 RepID=A0A6G4V2W5_9ACTN|nr:hypothetical protein [Streptomyces scabichelini]NGO08402.1 hypothetical protein [Streptomyces scabichelini]
MSLSPRVATALERQTALARAGQPPGTPLEGLVFCQPDGSPLRPQGLPTELRRRSEELAAAADRAQAEANAPVVITYDEPPAVGRSEHETGE